MRRAGRRCPWQGRSQNSGRPGGERVVNLRVVLTDDQLDAITKAAIERLKERTSARPEASPFMTVTGAAQYLRSLRQSADDLPCAPRPARVTARRRTL